MWNDAIWRHDCGFYNMTEEDEEEELNEESQELIDQYREALDKYMENNKDKESLKFLKQNLSQMLEKLTDEDETTKNAFRAEFITILERIFCPYLENQCDLINKPSPFAKILKKAMRKYPVQTAIENDLLAIEEKHKKLSEKIEEFTYGYALKVLRLNVIEGFLINDFLAEALVIHELIVDFATHLHLFVSVYGEKHRYVKELMPDMNEKLSTFYDYLHLSETTDFAEPAIDSSQLSQVLTLKKSNIVFPSGKIGNFIQAAEEYCGKDWNKMEWSRSQGFRKLDEEGSESDEKEVPFEEKEKTVNEFITNNPDFFKDPKNEDLIQDILFHLGFYECEGAYFEAVNKVYDEMEKLDWKKEIEKMIKEKEGPYFGIPLQIDYEKFIELLYVCMAEGNISRLVEQIDEVFEGKKKDNLKYFEANPEFLISDKDYALFCDLYESQSGHCHSNAVSPIVIFRKQLNWKKIIEESPREQVLSFMVKGEGWSSHDQLNHARTAINDIQTLIACKEKSETMTHKVPSEYESHCKEGFEEIAAITSKMKRINQSFAFSQDDMLNELKEVRGSLSQHSSIDLKYFLALLKNLSIKDIKHIVSDCDYQSGLSTEIRHLWLDMPRFFENITGNDEFKNVNALHLLQMTRYLDNTVSSMFLTQENFENMFSIYLAIIDDLIAILEKRPTKGAEKMLKHVKFQTLEEIRDSHQEMIQEDNDLQLGKNEAIRDSEEKLQQQLEEILFHNEFVESNGGHREHMSAIIKSGSSAIRGRLAVLERHLEGDEASEKVHKVYKDLLNKVKPMREALQKIAQ